MMNEQQRRWLAGPDYLRAGYRITSARRKTGHWVGGRAYHDGARCPACKRPWLLLLDLDARDPKLHRDELPVFGELTRLPLYFCWTCSGAMAYRVTGRKQVRLVWRERERFQPDWPYEDYPVAFERAAATLQPIPPAIEKLLLIEQELGPRWLSKPERAQLDIWCGWTRKGDRTRHQVGGLPFRAAARPAIECPDASCAWAKESRHFLGGGMKALAVVYNDWPWLPMVEPVDQTGVSVLFHICPGCLTIRAHQETC
jgi:hypothetical protein